MDALSQLMRHLHLETRVFHRSVHCGRWTLEAEYERKAMFHLVARGSCVLRAGPTQPERILQTGDAVIFPRPAAHRLASVAEASAEDEALLLCGYFDFGAAAAEAILAALPNPMVLRRTSPGAAATLALIVDEAARDAPGAVAALDKLSDVLFIHLLRQCVEDGLTSEGILAALADPHLGPALLLLYRQPAGLWTVERLARQVHLSRAAFARRFTATLKTPPMSFLAHLRLQLAREALREQRLSVAQAAELAGYATEAAFSRAFKRQYGVPPSGARRAGEARIKSSATGAP